MGDSRDAYASKNSAQLRLSSAWLSCVDIILKVESMGED
jgi:hypothetical protein